MLFSSAANCWSSDHNACHFGVSSHRRPSATKLVSLAWSWLSDAKWLSNIETMSKKAQKKITPRKLDHKDNLNTGYCESTVGWKPFRAAWGTHILGNLQVLITGVVQSSPCPGLRRLSFRTAALRVQSIEAETHGLQWLGCHIAMENHHF